MDTAATAYTCPRGHRRSAPFNRLAATKGIENDPGCRCRPGAHRLSIAWPRRGAVATTLESCENPANPGIFQSQVRNEGQWYLTHLNKEMPKILSIAWARQGAVERGVQPHQGPFQEELSIAQSRASSLQLCRSRWRSVRCCTFNG